MCDIIILIENRREMNLPMVRSTARALRRRERMRRGQPPEPRWQETEAIEALLENRECVLARGETESVARMACEQLTRAHVTPRLRMLPLPDYPTPPRDGESGDIRPQYRRPKRY